MVAHSRYKHTHTHTHKCKFIASTCGLSAYLMSDYQNFLLLLYQWVHLKQNNEQQSRRVCPSDPWFLVLPGGHTHNKPYQCALGIYVRYVLWACCFFSGSSQREQVYFNHLVGWTTYMASPRPENPASWNIIAYKGKKGAFNFTPQMWDAASTHCWRNDAPGLRQLFLAHFVSEVHSCGITEPPPLYL